MTDQEKYQRIRKIALKISEDKKIIESKGVERTSIENGIRFSRPQSLPK